MYNNDQSFDIDLVTLATLLYVNNIAHTRYMWISKGNSSCVQGTDTRSEGRPGYDQDIEII